MGLRYSVETSKTNTKGYHVLKVQENSPGQKAGIQEYFDFIIAIGNVHLNEDNSIILRAELRKNINRIMKMLIYNIKTQSVREVIVCPKDSWDGKGLLGIQIHFCDYKIASENVWHILDVYPSSPAAEAGLRSYTDYIIGTDDMPCEYNNLFAILQANRENMIKFHVYNTIDDACREVVVKPNSEWKGEGILGCGIGYGYLHRIPEKSLSISDKKPTHLVIDEDSRTLQVAESSVYSITSSLTTFNTEEDDDKTETNSVNENHIIFPRDNNFRVTLQNANITSA